VRFVIKTRDPFAFASMWDMWGKPAGGELQSFTIITAVAEDLVAWGSQQDAGYFSNGGWGKVPWSRILRARETGPASMEFGWALILLNGGIFGLFMGYNRKVITLTILNLR